MKAHNLKQWLLAYISFRFFLGGVEEFIILPTAWKYVSSVGGSIPFLGIVAASYAIGVSLFSPLSKRLAHEYQHVYFVMVIAAWVKLCASITYSIPLSKLFPLLGRLLSGLADSCDGVIYSVIAKYTDEVDRMKYTQVFDGIFTLGVAFGTIACSSLTINDNVFGWPQWSVGIGNSPAFVLAGIWFVFLILTCCLPCTFGVDIAALDKVRTASAREHNNDNDGSMTDETIANDDHSKDDNTQDDNSDEEQIEKCSPKSIDSRIACLLYLTFATMFFSSVATITPSLLTIEVFHLKVIHLKLLFVNGALTLIILYLVIFFCARHVQERSLLAFVLSLQLPPLVILVFLATLWKNVALNYCYLLLVYMCLGLPYFGFSICGSLLTKFTDEELFTNTYQPLTIILVQLAIISSRLIVGFVFSKPAFIIFGVVLIAMWLVGAIWFAFIFPRLNTRRRKYKF